MTGKIRISLADLEAYAKTVEEGIAFVPSDAQIRRIAGPDTGVTSDFHTQLERVTSELARAVGNARYRLTNLHTALVGTIADMGAADQAAVDDASALASAIEGMTTPVPSPNNPAATGNAAGVIG